MSDQDYIRKAAGIVGWSIDANTLTGRVFIELPQLGREKNLGLSANWRDTEDPVARDALAAQLVRQVDTLDTYYFFINGNGTVLIRAVINNANDTQTHGPDRTMNTIKAIVDSEVLK